MEPRDIEKIPASRLIVDPNIQRDLEVGRVEKMTKDFDPDALGVLTVSKRADGTFHIIDGQHRAEAAKIAKGETFPLPCQVWTGLSVESEARMFRLLNNTAKVDALPLFRVRLVEGEDTAVAINEIIEENGWKLASTTGNPRNGLVAVAVLERLYRRNPEALSKALATVIRAWGSDRPANDGRLIEGIGWLYHRYGAAVDVAELVPKLSMYAGGPGNFIGRARTLRDALGVSLPSAVAEIAVEVYNKGRRTRALPPWRSS